MPRNESAVAALPVYVDAGDAAVERHLEGRLGWQPVAEPHDPLVGARLAVLDVAARPVEGLPTIVLVTAHDDPVRAAGAALRADVVLRWPDDADRLEVVAAGLLGGGAPQPAVPLLGVGAAAGGVGATTITLGIAALAAWDLRHPTLALVTGWAPVPGIVTARPDDVGGPTLWRGLPDVPGVPGLRALRTAAPVRDVTAIRRTGGPARIVAEVAADQADVLVLRPDGAGLAALVASPAGTLVVVGDGPVPPARLRAAAAGRRLLQIPADARVARAAVAERIPADLPGRYVQTLRDVVTA